jgi:hypothetical protein
LSQKRQFFAEFFSENIFKNHNIGPRVGDFLPNGRLFTFGGFWSATSCASPPPLPSIFSDYSFLVHHPVNRGDLYLLTFVMASDYSVSRQFSRREKIVFSLWIKHHTQLGFFSNFSCSPHILGYFFHS